LFVSSVFPEKLVVPVQQTRAYTVWSGLTRFTSLIALATLAAAVLFPPSTHQRTTVSIIVSLAAMVLFLRSLFGGKVGIAALFLAVLCVFTPFRSSPFSYRIFSIFELATLALFAASPIMFRKTLMPTVASEPLGKL
jgi:hypothetical protein